MFEMTDEDISQIRVSRLSTPILAKRMKVSTEFVDRIRGMRCMAEIIKYKGKTIGRYTQPWKKAEWHTHQTKKFVG